MKDGRWYLVGITSFGSGCAKPGIPDVFTRLTNYSQWIADTVKHYELGVLVRWTNSRLTQWSRRKAILDCRRHSFPNLRIVQYLNWQKREAATFPEDLYEQEFAGRLLCHESSFQQVGSVNTGLGRSARKGFSFQPHLCKICAISQPYRVSQQLAYILFLQNISSIYIYQVIYLSRIGWVVTNFCIIDAYICWHIS